MSDCLVLDQNWFPVDFCTWENAVKLWFEERAEIIRVDEGGKVLHSKSLTMGFPRVIVVKNQWTRRKKKSVPCSRKNLLLRDNAICQYCGKPVRTREYTLDHVIPLCQGGKAGWKNLVIACHVCNTAKGGRTPEQAGMKLLKKPVAPKLADGRFSFRLYVRKIRPEWKDWETWLYENAVMEV